jgi:cation diffusion facilitator family transporter
LPYGYIEILQHLVYYGIIFIYYINSKRCKLVKQSPFFRQHRKQNNSQAEQQSAAGTHDKYARVRRIMWIILFINLAVAAVKIVLGIIIHSNSMTADGFHSLTDGSSNLVGLIGIRLASRPIDEDHPYGHGKFETLAGLLISGILFFLSGKILVDAANRFVHPVTPMITPESLILLLGTLLINIAVSTAEYRKGKELGSQILISDSMHTRSDIFISLGVLVTLTGIRLGLPSFIDPALSLVVSGFILYAAVEIFRLNRDVLVDKAVIDEERIKALIMEFSQVKDTHNIRSRGDKNALYIDMHIMIQPDLSIEESHRLIHEIENRIRRDISKTAQVIAHIEPYEEKDDNSPIDS